MGTVRETPLKEPLLSAVALPGMAPPSQVKEALPPALNPVPETVKVVPTVPVLTLGMI